MGQIVDKVSWTPVRDRKVLFARSRGQELFYCMGGKREKGETDLEALVREVKEEGDVMIIASSAKLTHTFEGPCHGYSADTVLKMACYEAAYLGNLTPSSEVEELAWFTFADMHRTTELGQTILRWFKDQDLID